MYLFIKSIHNINRYIVLVLLIAALAQAIMGWFQKKSWTETQRKNSLFFTIFLDIQLLLGLILYFISPVTQAAFKDFSGAMSNDLQRFFAIEHIFYGFVAVTLAHIGSGRAKKAATDLLKHRNTAIFFGIALLVILAGMPWDRWLPFN